MLTCWECDREYDQTRKTHGPIYLCNGCSPAETITLLGGNMIYEHKTAPVLEIKPLTEAKAFARKTKRLGAGVTCSLVTSKEVANAALTNTTHDADKRGTGAGDGDQYKSNLGEKRSVRR